MSDLRVSKREAKGDAARLLHAASRVRVAAALADLFVPESLGLSEQHRTTMASLLARLIRSIEDDLRSQLAEDLDAERLPELHAALTSARIELALPILATSEALRDSDLISLLLRRVEEHRIHRTALARPQASEDGLLVELVRDADQELARTAMALLVAQSRRLDRFQEPVIASAELPAELEHRLVWTVAAALRVYLITRQSVEPGDADAALAKAAGARLASYDEGEGLEARSMQLAKRLSELGRLSDHLLGRALSDGHLLFLLAGLGMRCRMSLDAVWEVLSDPRGSGPAFLLRAADVSREEAGPMLLVLASAVIGSNGDERVVQQMDLFDGTSEEEARAAISLWQIDAAYRAAITRVASRRTRPVAQ
jgi:hypothetical protein